MSPNIPISSNMLWFVVVFQLLSHIWLFAIPWTAVHQGSLSFTIFRSLLQLMSIVSMMPSNHLILCYPFLFLPSLTSNMGVFSSESALCIRWPKYGRFSFSISPSIEYSVLISFRIDWFVLLAVGPRNSQESSLAPQFKSISSSALSLLYGPALTAVQDYWENHSYDYMDLCWQSDLSAFWYVV